MKLFFKHLAYNFLTNRIRILKLQYKNDDLSLKIYISAGMAIIIKKRKYQFPKPILCKNNYLSFSEKRLPIYFTK